jgi:hypothetical protein
MGIVVPVLATVVRSGRVSGTTTESAAPTEAAPVTVSDAAAVTALRRWRVGSSASVIPRVLALWGVADSFSFMTLTRRQFNRQRSGDRTTDYYSCSDVWMTRVCEVWGFLSSAVF